jgi:hypothetical protein
MLIREKMPQRITQSPTISRMLSDLLIARCTEGDQILGRVVAQSAPRLNLMDLKAFHPPAPLASSAILPEISLVVCL